MALTLAQLQAERDALTKAIGSGALMVQFADRLTTYRSIADLKEARRLIDADIRALAATTSRPKDMLVVASKGF